MPLKAPNIFQQFILSFVPTKYDRLMKDISMSVSIFLDATNSLAKNEPWMH